MWFLVHSHILFPFTQTFRNFFLKWRKRTKDNVFQLQNTDPIGKLASGLPPRIKETSHKTLELIQGSEHKSSVRVGWSRRKEHLPDGGGLVSHGSFYSGGKWFRKT